MSVSSAQAEQVVVTDLRSYQAPDNLRLVFDVSGPVEHRLFTLENPKRIVIDIDNARLKQVLPPLSSEATMVNNIRSSPYKKTGLRVVLDLKQAVRPKTFVLGPAGQYGHRLVVDLYDDAQTEPVIVSKSHEPERQEWVIAIDAGHGGEDPGAIGRRYRTKEKDVVLAIARELERLIKAQPDMRPLMVRRSDYYVGLKQRPLIARKAGADIFISIHADAVPGRRASGSSVYALTERGASDRMAKYLEASENAADSLGGVYADSAEYSDPTLKKVLFDLSETASIGFSLDLGADILKELGRIGPVHRKSVGQAGFAVLKSPIGDVPSVLVETAFISNPTEEKKLRSKTYQRAMAKGILNGIKRFFDRKELKPRVRSMQAKQGATATEKPRHHIVRRGESLTSIARKYNIAVDTLRFANNIHGNNLLAGSKLLIP
ncbi:MAG: N-acetylmuramoyl-L-alanine amidase [Gammaproteobacteria bacterium]|nr:N-acetylmuramoyl-L-alanine amidase [Gammaproteobacteria bacterium]